MTRTCSEVVQFRASVCACISAAVCMPHYLGAHNDQLPVGCLLAQLVEHCTGISEVTIQVLFRPFFHRCLNCIEKTVGIINIKSLLLFLVKDHSEKLLSLSNIHWFTLCLTLEHANYHLTNFTDEDWWFQSKLLFK